MHRAYFLLNPVIAHADGFIIDFEDATGIETHHIYIYKKMIESLKDEPR